MVVEECSEITDHQPWLTLLAWKSCSGETSSVVRYE